MNGGHEVVTVWFGTEISIDEVRRTVKKLVQMGYTVRPPFYIGYNVNVKMVYNYVCMSIDNSDALYVIGEKGTLLTEIVKYAENHNKPIVREGSFQKCC